MDEMFEPTGTIEDAIRDLLNNDDEAAREYLKESFLTEAMLALFHARRDAELTQAQLAERLGTKQSSIARLERDLSGSVTLRRYVEVALACGVMPLDVALVPVAQIKQYATHNPGAEKTPAAFNAWLASQVPVSLSTVISLQPVMSANASMIETSTPPAVIARENASTALSAGVEMQQSLWSANSFGVQTKGFAA